MATVTLDRAFMHAVSDPTAPLTFATAGRGDVRTTPGEVRRNADGSTRLVTRAGDTQALTVTALRISAADLATLDGWRGTVVLFRDVWGRKMYGTYLTVTPTNYTDRGGHNATFTLQQITYPESI